MSLPQLLAWGTALRDSAVLGKGPGLGVWLHLWLLRVASSWAQQANLKFSALQRAHFIFRVPLAKHILCQ